jgi:hypothetical protein
VRNHPFFFLYAGKKDAYKAIANTARIAFWASTEMLQFGANICKILLLSEEMKYGEIFWNRWYPRKGKC